MKYYQNTIANKQAFREDQSWKVRLVGYPEVKYLEELLRILGSLKKPYRITNSDTRQRWYVDPAQTPVYGFHKRDYVYDLRTGEVLCVNGDTIRIFVYKNK